MKSEPKATIAVLGRRRDSGAGRRLRRQRQRRLDQQQYHDDDPHDEFGDQHDAGADFVCPR